MKKENYTISVNLPSVDEFAESYKAYGKQAKTDLNFLFDKIVSPESFIKAKVATLDLKLPAVAGIAEDCYQAVLEQNPNEWRDFVKQFIGAVTCLLMECNGFQKTGIKKSIPHERFTKGEFYELKK